MEGKGPPAGLCLWSCMRASAFMRMYVWTFSRHYTHSEGEIAGVFIAQGFSALETGSETESGNKYQHGPGYEVAQPLSAYLCLFSNKISLLDIVAFVFKNRFDGK